MNLIDNYNKSLKDLYEHVGFVEEWTVYAIEDYTDCYWKLIDNREVFFAKTINEVKNEEGEYYSNEIHYHRFYKSPPIYKGSKLTMIIVDTNTDGNKYFGFFDNSKQITEK